MRREEAAPPQGLDEGTGAAIRAGLRAVGWGLVYVLLVVGLVIAGRAGQSFIYQGF